MDRPKDILSSIYGVQLCDLMDREKVIKGLHETRRYLEDKEWSDRCASRHIDAINDALELLKAIENKNARNPVIICPHCGKRVK